jgi:molybdate transport system ATP-binding protein
LLSLLTGDNPQAYRNEIYLFGRLRGSGESIWDIKEKIGFVSAEFQLNYWQDSPLLNVMLSGFFDSIGLYQKPSAEQKQLAQAWLAAIGLEQKTQTSRFSQLSFGEQRLVLIARAMLKTPQLLILDEPLQGLDAANRRRMLAFIEAIGQAGSTGLIYVTHYGQEVPHCITHTLHLQRKN